MYAREKVKLENYKALTKDSKNQNDLKDVKVKTFNDFAKKGEHTEFLCKLHMNDRLLNYCHQDTLVDVVFSGLKEFSFFSIDTNFSDTKCKACDDLAEYGIKKID